MLSCFIPGSSTHCSKCHIHCKYTHIPILRLIHLPLSRKPADLVVPPTSTPAERRAQIADMHTTNRLHHLWQSQLETLYRLNIQCHDTCQTCSYVQIPPAEYSWVLALGVLRNYTSIYHAIAGTFTEIVLAANCERCDANRTKTRRRTILAAPKILVVQFQILSPRHKIMHTLSCPEILDLTNRQEVSTLPLQYRLTGVVSHSGPSANAGHYIASMRERDPNEFMCISDEVREDFSRQEFLANPQMPTMASVYRERGYQVYIVVL
jgi:hypothetical protein